MQDRLTFRPMEAKDRKIVSEMIKSLYRALNAPDGYMNDQKISATFNQLELSSPAVEINVFEIDNKIVGYAMLFRFWYNEYGGMVLNVDELYVDVAHRNHGIASEYLSTLTRRNGEHVALSLEVLPENKAAYALYKRTGFSEKETITLYKLLQ